MTNQDYESYEAGRPLLSGGVVHLDVLFAILRRRREFFILGLVASLLCAIVYLHVATRRYAVTMEIMPTSQPGRISAGGSLGALSSLAGISLGEGGDSQFRVFLDSLQSPVAAEALAGRQDLLREIFPNEWSDADKTWREPPSYVRPVSQAIRRLLGFTVVPWSPPSKYRVYLYLQDQLKVIQDQKSGVVTLEMENAKPAVAVHVLLAVNNAVDSFMRKRALEHSTSYIQYLTKELSTVTIAEYRSALVGNLAEQEKTRMMASGPVPYVSEVLGPPMVSTAPVSPSAVFALVASVLAGAFLGVLLAILAEARGWQFSLNLRFGRQGERVFRAHTEEAQR